MKKILLTNDDGYDSKGLHALRDALKNIAEIIIIAPSGEKSACGHSLTLTRPLRMIEIEKNFYKLDDGTPTDCIYLGINTIFKGDKKPDLIISGINLGSNMGEDITYSGTAAGAMEGVIQGIPSIAISQMIRNKALDSSFDFSLAKKSIHDIVEKIFSNHFPLGERRFLNINVPPISLQECKGYRITQKGFRVYENDFATHHNPRGQKYFWLGQNPLKWKERENQKLYTSDFKALEENYISITPITLDMTSYEDIDSLNLWLK